MAFQDTDLNKQDNLPPTKLGTKFYNVDQTVGPSTSISYRKDDVQLVQLFISEIVKSETLKPMLPPLEVDGRFGPITKKWIEWYQNSRGLTPDGKVSQGKSGRTKSGKCYMIAMLNWDFNYRQRYWHDNLATDPRTPLELRCALMRSSPSNSYGDTFIRGAR